MRTQPESKTLEVKSGDGHTTIISRRRWSGPIMIGLAVVSAIGMLAGGIYLALLRVPAAPPRTQQIGSLRVTFATDPRVPWTGPAEVRVSIVDAGGSPVTDAAVTLTYDMDTDSIGRRMAGTGEPGRATARIGSAGQYTAPVTFTMAGQWRVRVAVSRMGQQEGQGQFLVTVR